MDSEAYLQEMQKNGDNKATLLDQNCSTPWTSDDMFDVDNIEDLEEVSKHSQTSAKKTLTSWTLKGVIQRVA